MLFWLSTPLLLLSLSVMGCPQSFNAGTDHWLAEWPTCAHHPRRINDLELNANWIAATTLNWVVFTFAISSPLAKEALFKFPSLPSPPHHHHHHRYLVRQKESITWYYGLCSLHPLPQPNGDVYLLTINWLIPHPCGHFQPLSNATFHPSPLSSLNRSTLTPVRNINCPMVAFCYTRMEKSRIVGTENVKTNRWACVGGRAEAMMVRPFIMYVLLSCLAHKGCPVVAVDVWFEKCLIKLPWRIVRNAIWVKMCLFCLLCGESSYAISILWLTDFSDQ